jgi:predicted NBD/HSP70 family sugar kinase
VLIYRHISAQNQYFACDRNKYVRRSTSDENEAWRPLLANPQSIRYVNAMRVLNALFRQGQLTRSQLARQLGLNRSSIGYIVEDLIADGLVRERESGPARNGDRHLGRPGVSVEINPLGGIFVGVEIGVDHITLVALDMAAREILNQTTRYATARHTPDEAISRVAELLNEAIGSLHGRASRIKGVCVAIPALVRDGIVRNGLMLGWRNVALRQKLEEELSVKVPVVIENDANAFAVGETYLGAASSANTVVAFLLIENGAGGGVVIGGTLFRGAAGFAGEFGQLPVCNEPPEGKDVRRGPLERFIGKDAVVEAYRAAAASPDGDFETFLEALNAGDAAAVRAANEWGDWLARGLICLTNILSPELIILGGSVATVYRFVETRVQTVMRREFLEGLPVPAIELSKTASRGAAAGGACLLHQSMFSVDESRLYGARGDDGSGDGSEAQRHRRGSPMQLRV